jgi:hypothetical protein
MNIEMKSFRIENIYLNIFSSLRNIRSRIFFDYANAQRIVSDYGLDWHTSAIHMEDELCSSNVMYLAILASLFSRYLYLCKLSLLKKWII